jgi:hypothetical protein
VPTFKSETLITDLYSMNPPDSRGYYFFTTLYKARTEVFQPDLIKKSITAPLTYCNHFCIVMLVAKKEHIL